MSFGGGSSPKPAPVVQAPAPSPAPRRILPEVQAAKSALRERIRGAQSRQESIVAPLGLLNIPAPIRREELSNIVG
jgi:hypothetical protein